MRPYDLSGSLLNPWISMDALRCASTTTNHCCLVSYYISRSSISSPRYSGSALQPPTNPLDPHILPLTTPRHRIVERQLQAPAPPLLWCAMRPYHSPRLISSGVETSEPILALKLNAKADAVTHPMHATNTLRLIACLQHPLPHMQNPPTILCYPHPIRATVTVKQARTDECQHQFLPDKTSSNSRTANAHETRLLNRRLAHLRLGHPGNAHHILRLMLRERSIGDDRLGTKGKGRDRISWRLH